MRIAACLLLALTCPPVAAHDMKQHSQDAAGTRIVNLSSRGHLISGMRWNDLNYDDEPA